jgi:hypothetical protein
MTTYQWKVLDIYAEGEEITSIKYRVTASNDKNSVITEGNWEFKDKTHFLQDQTTEKDVIAWIKAESIIDEKCIIEDNLEKQLTALEPVALKKPWVLPTFTVKI